MMRLGGAFPQVGGRYAVIDAPPKFATYSQPAWAAPGIAGSTTICAGELSFVAGPPSTQSGAALPKAPKGKTDTVLLPLLATYSKRRGKSTATPIGLLSVVAAPISRRAGATFTTGDGHGRRHSSTAFTARSVV